MNPLSNSPSNNIVPAEMRRNHKPVSGALYRLLRNSNAKNGVKTGEVVMVVSECPHLVDKSYTYTNNGVEQTTVVQEWADLVILWGERLITMDGSREPLWYDWFERIVNE